MTARLTRFTSEGMTFDVLDSGPLDGPVVVALHGFPQTSASWAGVVPPLVAAGYRVLAPDQRGYSPGARPPDIASYAVARLVGDVLALADAAGAERFHVLGHDWGAAVAWVLAGVHADRVATLTAVSVPHPAAMARALAGSQALRSWYMAFFQVPGLAERLFRVRGGALARRLLAGTGMPDPEPAVSMLADPASATGPLSWYRALRLPGGLRTGRTAVPTLYVWSDRDTALGRRAAEGTAAHVDGPYRFVVLPGVSHWVPEERPAELAALVLGHLAAHPLDR
ncbi:alpha/beta fold hydrolase [Microlunatus capsulatus]|uniref:Pimeloyl-ACP methyl ester carboxylesterase n=1 Tax=Microlunatus capsulatus TaxID=99117 RepID=A0ABS4ZC44_9ACTN|nr:alpha/beta fold hydrolase [Microlunatus capsulatus]MBP2417733.1 pimeloyl-ACP methyl ester carboxylesterase [Microlunatus capsulatus]